MKKLLFIDRDGTIIKEPFDHQIDSLEKFSFVPGAIGSLKNISKTLNFSLVMVTNQDGLGTDSFPEPDFWPYQELMIRVLESEGIKFDDIFIDRSRPEDNSPYRKPGTAMLHKFLDGTYDLSNSFVIGDRWSDVKLADNMNAMSILFGEEIIGDNIYGLEPNFRASSWAEVFSILSRESRKVNMIRNTSETKIKGSIDLDGSGESRINTGLGFFDHMLVQIAKHGQIDLLIEGKGDLHVDEHHTVEDTAIVLGQLIKKALGKKAGIQRYGFALPMDEAKAQVLLDFGGRPWLEWDVEFKREKIGDVPTEMFHHFFKSFSDNAECNLNILARGDNEHHKIEAVFKAFARALKMAKERNSNDFNIPSTKGIL